MLIDRPPKLFQSKELNEYLIIALPYAEINEEIKAFKKEFFQKYGPYAGQNSCGHIPMMSFFQTDDREQKVIHCVEQVLASVKSFEVFLSGFEFDSLQRAVYIDILNKESLCDVYHQLRLSLFRELVSLAFLNKTFRPMMKIGHQLTPLQFLNAVGDNKARAYTNNFRLSRLHILKRKAPYTSWEQLTAIPFARSENELMGMY
ncbi:2'-5' RNA ligase family protein [Roseivirga sp.]|uniref:2'-5' RNA ligase family protein n=1 Tax=Roseivirga sp. TaxID=1964215 RepID=UPI003B5240DC